MNLARHLIMARQTLGAERVELRSFPGLQSVDSLLQAQVVFRLLESLGELVGERRKVPLQRQRHGVSLFAGTMGCTSWERASAATFWIWNVDSGSKNRGLWGLWRAYPFQSAIQNPNSRIPPSGTPVALKLICTA